MHPSYKHLSAWFNTCLLNSVPQVHSESKTTFEGWHKNSTHRDSSNTLPLSSFSACDFFFHHVTSKQFLKHLGLDSVPIQSRGRRLLTQKAAFLHLTWPLTSPFELECNKTQYEMWGLAWPASEFLFSNIHAVPAKMSHLSHTSPSEITWMRSQDRGFTVKHCTSGFTAKTTSSAK